MFKTNETLISKYGKYAHIFAETNAFAFAKAIHIFQKNTCEFDIVLTKTVNILTTKELIKLTMLCTMGSGFYLYLGLQLCRCVLS